MVAFVLVLLVLEKFVLERVVPVRLSAKKLVVVAEVPVAREKVRFARVDEELERKPLLKTMVVPVAFSPVPRVVNGKAKLDPPPVGHVVLQVSPVRQSVVTAKVVDVAFVVVELTPVKFCRVVEPFNNKLDKLVSPLIAVSVPVKLAALDIV